MALSGSTDFNLDRDEILNGALRLIGKSSRGKTASSADLSDAAQALELLVKSWQAEGIRLWKQKQATLFVTKGTAKYQFPGANCAFTTYETAVSTAAAAAASTIFVDSVTNMVANDYIGFVLDDDTTYWATISSVGASAVTIVGSLPSAAAVDNVVYFYRTQITRPLRVTDARRLDSSDVPIEVVSRFDYFELPNKTTTGKVNQVYYDPQLSNGNLYIWPTGSAAGEKIEIDVMMPLEDFDSSNIDPDFPQEWLKALRWNLASDLGPEYGIALRRQVYIDTRAKTLLDMVSGFDAEAGSVYFTVED